MKKTFMPVLSILVLLMSLILINGCKVETNKNDYLRKVLDNLEQIKSATYSSTGGGIAPGDTIDKIRSFQHTEEYFNPIDTFIGSSFARTYQFGESKSGYVYDGIAMTRLDWDMKTIRTDSFKNNQLPFRPMQTPFFNNTKSIIKYVLETNDSISTELMDFGDSIKIIINIPNKVVEFFGKAYVMDNPYLAREDAFSRYEVWINKSDNLPFRYERIVPHETSWQFYKKAEFNKSSIKDFVASNYFPLDFTIATRENQKTTKIDLEGKLAPDWVLRDINNNSIALKDLKSKVLMIEFTGIGCAPCHSAIPFLKQLADEYKNKDFELISIETWSMNVDASKRYKESNNLNYIFLAATNDVKKSYNAESVPAFYFLDKARVIRKIIKGYEKGTTDKEIRDAINELI